MCWKEGEKRNELLFLCRLFEALVSYRGKALENLNPTSAKSSGVHDTQSVQQNISNFFLSSIPRMKVKV